MNPDWPKDDMLAADTFFDLCRARLHAPHGFGGAENAIGDFTLNPDLAPRTPLKQAAVLVAIVRRGGRAAVILTRRTAHLSAHAGQIAFPGGRIEPGDASPVAAALREAEEEIGLRPDDVRVLGLLDPYLTGTGYRVVPVVAEVIGEPALLPNPDEVAELFEVPLAFLMDTANLSLGSREIGGRMRHFYELTYGRHHIWGATAGMIRALYERVLGR